MTRSLTSYMLFCKQPVLGDPRTDNPDLVLLSTSITRQPKKANDSQDTKSTVRAVCAVHGDKNVVDGAST
jgi:hypothetical protein